MKKINWGIIGLGEIAQKFSEGFKETTNARLLAISSKDSKKLEKFKKNFLIEEKFAFKNYEDLIFCQDVDIIYIALPNSLHHFWVIKCIENNKNILVEKPATIKISEMEDIDNKLLSKKIFFGEAYMYRHHPQIKILIENNVITIENYKKFKQNPLLLTHPDEIIKFFKKCDKNVRLLLDVGHLKVSSKTQGFNLSKGHEMLKPYIEGYHLSDNNGLRDSNEEFTKKSWFYNKMKKDVKYISIEVYTKNLKKLKSLQNLIRKKYGN